MHVATVGAAEFRDRAGLAPGWYDVEGRRVWWDGRAWDDIPDTEDAAPQASA